MNLSAEALTLHNGKVPPARTRLFVYHKPTDIRQKSVALKDHLCMEVHQPSII